MGLTEDGLGDGGWKDRGNCPIYSDPRVLAWPQVEYNCGTGRNSLGEAARIYELTVK
jgi:hypothetical protein